MASPQQTQDFLHWLQLWLQLNLKTEPEPELEPQEPLVFNYGKQPKGTPGRGDFNLQEVLGLDDYGYKFVFVSNLLLSETRCS
jgi:hypothetical protein